ncbi:Wzz/FepE/Etk N-terminal domain-containing protein [Pseudomonas sp. Marseille-P9899]|uniref:Wzz/FepE/Etk N-terminal domain-containing protein n=1 Tax=Pseudomonas sp. Marseille-P9899 TaxID=2730401 RepID=UPI00158C9882|nr:Wzz/FepE/Etk N-terminal domain-containing protein [Pseudomonas sp. Marseille-P9899]
MTTLARIPDRTAGEVDISALILGVWAQRKLVGVSAAIGGVLFAAYAFFATPVYETTTLLRAVPLNELDALNRSNLYDLPPKRALLEVGDALQSYEVRLAYFRENRDLFSRFDDPSHSLEQNFEEFNREALEIKLPDATRPYLTLEMTYPEGVAGPQIVNSFVEFAINKKRQEISADMDVIVRNRLSELNSQVEAAKAVYDSDKQTRIASLIEADHVQQARLEDELKALRLQLKTGRGDRITQLDEAIAIATSLGIKRPSTPSSMGDVERAGAANVVRTEVNGQSLPLYFMGSDALQAERKVLQSRKSDDFTAGRIAEIQKELRLLANNRQVEALNARKDESVFLDGLEGVRKEMVRLKTLDINLDRLGLVSVDRKALQPTKPVKPRRLLLCVGGLAAGLFLGLIIAALRYSMRQRVRSPREAGI